MRHPYGHVLIAHLPIAIPPSSPPLTLPPPLPFTAQGASSKLILSGLNRLFLRDPEREARVQSATFLIAYLLGLPCFCFSPNVMEAVRLSSDVPDMADSLASTSGLNRLLVYLLAPVAAEESRHAQLIVSDPRQARALVRLFLEKNGGGGEGEESVLGGRSEEEMLAWAFAEAKRMLTANTGAWEKLRKRMESGGATVGDCVALLEGQ
jgi:hypothetical protein